MQGVVQVILFRNEQNGYAVMEAREGRARFTAVGTIPFVQAGERVKFQGEWVEHPEYGRQLKVSSFEILKPSSLEGMEKFLSSGLIRGVGPNTAKRIIKKFGMDALDIIQMAPERLAEISGIGPAKAEIIGASFQQRREMQNVMVFLQTYGVSVHFALKIYKQYGDKAVPLIRENPYRLVDEIPGIGFRTADALAARVGIASSDFRVCAGVKFILSSALEEGHTYLPREELTDKALSLLGERDPIAVDNALARLFAELKIEQVGESQCVYLRKYFEAEQKVAQKLIGYARAPAGGIGADFHGILSAVERELGVQLAAQQKEALSQAVRHCLAIITGGPGTGKTTLIRCLIALFERSGLQIALCAPTGRAAKRISETTGYEAKTIHRLLEYSMDGEESGKFQRNEDNPLEVDALVVDEMSMVDIFLMHQLVRALKSGVRLVLVGDADQLPSVGAGNVLFDMILSGVLPCVRLTEIFRQAAQSQIVVNAHKINQGLMPDLSHKDGDFFFERREGQQEVLRSVVALCTQRIPGYFGLDPMKDIQVLSPMKKGVCGVGALNAALQQMLNPPAPEKNEWPRGETVFREGDRVMQVRNNYQIEWISESGGDTGEGVFNGDLGVILSIDPEDGLMRVRFDEDHIVEYDQTQIDDLEIAYAMTIHKSQGSEFACVVIPFVGGPPMLLSRNLLYTAVTRARRLVVGVGRESVIKQMVDNLRERQRYSGLDRRLKQLALNGPGQPA